MQWLEAQREGIDQGFLDGKRAVVFSLLEAKFGEIPKEVRERIESMNDEVALSSLAISCSNSQSMQEFIADLL